MYMRKLSIVVVLFAVSACSPKGAETQVSANSVAACPDTSSVEVAQFYEPIKGLTLDIPYHFRSDKKYQHRSTGKDRRTVVLEFLDVDASKAIQAAEAGLVNAGYSAVDRPVADASGVLTAKFRKENSPEIFLQASDGAGEYPSDKDAKGTISFSW